MIILFDILLQDIIIQYNLKSIVGEDGFVHIEIYGSIYGLLQAGRLAHDNLVVHQAPYNYALVNILQDYRCINQMVYHSPLLSMILVLNTLLKLSYNTLLMP